LLFFPGHCRIDWHSALKVLQHQRGPREYKLFA
jgi:hypothetical protein